MNISKSELSVIKLELMTSHSTATRGLTDEAIVKLARDKGAITGAQFNKYMGIEKAPLEQEDEKPMGRRKIRNRVNLERAHEAWVVDDPMKHELQRQAEEQARRFIMGEEARQEPVQQEQPQQEEKEMAQPATAQQAELLAQLMATMAPRETAATTEARIIELINEHSPIKTVEVKNVEKKEAKNVGLAHKCFETALKYVSCGLDLFFYGETGAGKSTTARMIADALEMPFFSMGALLTKFETLGSNTPNDGYLPSVIYKWLDNKDGGLLCIDEIDASCPRALTTIMAIFDYDGEVTFPNSKTLKRTDKHIIVITGNTVGAGANQRYNGRVKLDDAFLSRFIRVEHGYDEGIENGLGGKLIADYARKFRSVVEKKQLSGAIIAPRTIKQAASIYNTDLTSKEKRTMLKNVFKQGLTDKDYQVVTNEIGSLV